MYLKTRCNFTSSVLSHMRREQRPHSLIASSFQQAGLGCKFNLHPRLACLMLEQIGQVASTNSSFFSNVSTSN